MLLFAGVPVSEQKAKASGYMMQLNQKELEGMRVACKVREEVGMNWLSLLLVLLAGP